MAGDGGVPALVLARVHREVRDRSLAELVVAVEDLHAEGLARADRLARGREARLSGIAKRTLPEARFARRDVEVAGQPAKLLERRMTLCAAAEVGVEVPAVEHRDAAPDVADRDRQVDRLVGRLGGCLVTRDDEPLVVHEADLLRRVLGPRRNEQGSKASKERTLGGA